MQNIFVELLPPWIETGLQPAFYDKESGTVLQQVARMYAKVNWLVEMFNKFSKDTTDFVNEFVDDTNEEIRRFEHDTTETVEEYIAKFVALKDFVDDYFENLDVQEEIDHKLDEMLLNGTLQEIITTYVQTNVTWTFDSVSDMAQATNLIDGSFAGTTGYYTSNDGGGATYKITSTQPSGYYETLTGGLYAELIINESMVVNQFGAYGDNTHDDSDAINAALSSGASEITFVKDSTYLVRGYNSGDPEGGILSALSGQHGLSIPANTIVNLNFATIKCIPNSRQNYNIFCINNVDNVILKNGTIIGDVANHTGASGEWGYGVSLKKATNVTLDNLYISLCWGDGINLQSYSATGELCKDIYINNVTCYDNRRQGMSIECGDNIIVTNSKFNKTGTTSHTNPSAGVDIEPTAGNSVRNVKFYDCEFNENYGDGFECMGDVAYITLDSCEIIDNQANTSAGTLFVNQCTDVTIRKCHFINTLTGTVNFKTIPIYLKDNFYFYDNKLENVILLLRRSTATDNKFIIKGCEFDISVAVSYNKVIAVTDAPDALTTLNGCELIIDNCRFINTSNDNTLDISGWVDAGGSVKNRLSLMKVTNCYFYCGLYAIMARYANSIIKNNHILMSKSFPIIVNQPNYLHTINNNIIEETSWSNNTAGIISNDNAANIVLTNNLYFKRTQNAELGVASPQYSPTRWLQNNTPSGIDEEHENYIINNV